MTPSRDRNVTQSELPPISELIPHSGRMALLDCVLEHSSEETLCELEIRPESSFRNAQGAVPVWVGTEYMAQCMAVHGGLAARKADEGSRPKRGFLVGSRRIRFQASEFQPGQRLHVRARHLRGEIGFVSFQCSIHDAPSNALLVEGMLNVFITEESEPALGEKPQ